MPDDKMPNEDFDISNDTESIGDLSRENSIDSVTDLADTSSVDIPEAGAIAENYNFDNIQGEAINGQEVKLDTYANNDPVTVRPVEFTQFDSYTPTNTDTNKNLELLMDIKLELTVELGRCQLPVKKVLELTRGSIIELDKVAGESVELYANGKHVANGEVVVIEDNFGLRITSITDPEERIKSLN